MTTQNTIVLHIQTVLNAAIEATTNKSSIGAIDDRAILYKVNGFEALELDLANDATTLVKSDGTRVPSRSITAWMKRMIVSPSKPLDPKSKEAFIPDDAKQESKGKQPATKTKQVAIALSPIDKLASLHYAAVDAWLTATIASAHEQHAAMIATLDGYTKDELSAREAPVHDSLAAYYDSTVADSIRDDLRFASKKEHIAAFIEQAGLAIDTGKGANAIQVIRTDKGVSIIVELVGKYAPDDLTIVLNSYKERHADAWDGCKLSYDKELVKLMGKAPIVLIFSL